MAATPNDVSTQTIKLISEALETDTAAITRDTNLDELGIDSMKLTEVIMDLEELFDIRIDLNAAESWEAYKNVGNIIDAISELRAKQGTS